MNRRYQKPWKVRWTVDNGHRGGRQTDRKSLTSYNEKGRSTHVVFKIGFHHTLIHDTRESVGRKIEREEKTGRSKEVWRGSGSRDRWEVVLWLRQSARKGEGVFKWHGRKRWHRTGTTNGTNGVSTDRTLLSSLTGEQSRNRRVEKQEGKYTTG